MPNALENSEMRLLKNERAQTEIEVKAAMSSFARELSEGGLGNEMLNDLKKEPVKPSWFKRFINRILRTF